MSPLCLNFLSFVFPGFVFLSNCKTYRSRKMRNDTRRAAANRRKGTAAVAMRTGIKSWASMTFTGLKRKCTMAQALSLVTMRGAPMELCCQQRKSTYECLVREPLSLCRAADKYWPSGSCPLELLLWMDQQGIWIYTRCTSTRELGAAMKRV